MGRDHRFEPDVRTVARPVFLVCLAWSGLVGAAMGQVPAPPPDGEWTLNAAVESSRAITDLGLGAVPNRYSATVGDRTL